MANPEITTPTASTEHSVPEDVDPPTDVSTDNWSAAATARECDLRQANERRAVANCGWDASGRDRGSRTHLPDGTLKSKFGVNKYWDRNYNLPDKKKATGPAKQRSKVLKR